MSGELLYGSAKLYMRREQVSGNCPLGPIGQLAHVRIECDTSYMKSLTVSGSA